MYEVKVVKINNFVLRALFRLLIFGNTEAFFPWNKTLYTTEPDLSAREEMHEFGIHGAQVDELGPTKFMWLVIWYSVKYGGWTKNPLEIEAVVFDGDPKYLEHRKPFAWEHYKGTPIWGRFFKLR